MDSNGQAVLGILGACTLLAPIVVSLWKLFAIREQLQSNITENRHRLQLLEQRSTHLVDQQELFLNGLQERLQHVRDRSLDAEKGLNRRLCDVENFLEKSTAFEVRQ